MTTLTLQQLWNENIKKYPLSEDQAGLWLAIHTEDTIRRGFRVTFDKWGRDQHKMDEQYVIRYASKTLNNIKARAAAVAQSAKLEVGR